MGFWLLRPFVPVQSDAEPIVATEYLVKDSLLYVTPTYEVAMKETAHPSADEGRRRDTSHT